VSPQRSSFAIACVAACSLLTVAPACDTEGAATNGEPPPLLQPGARPANDAGLGAVDDVHCEGWVGIGGSEDCVYIWSNCSDREDREVRCSRSGDMFQCACIRGGASITSFESAAFCDLAAGALSIDRALLSEAVLPGCGWSIRP
jgi:hypothetical protein